LFELAVSLANRSYVEGQTNRLLIYEIDSKLDSIKPTHSAESLPCNNSRPDAVPFLEWRSKMTDEEWVETNAGDDESFFARLGG
jgi:hypothetical protein